MTSRIRKRKPARSEVPAEFSVRRSTTAASRTSAKAARPAYTAPATPADWQPFTDPGYISQPQHKFVCDLLDSRELMASDTFRAAVQDMDTETYDEYIKSLKVLLKRTTRGKASELITTLKALPRKQVAKDAAADEPVKKVPAVPGGRYALLDPADDLNPVKFYLVREGKDNREKGGKNWTGALFVERFASDDTFPVKGAERYRVLEAIAANPLEAAQRFGDSWECCSRCGRGLTRRLSRTLRIGPVCLSRAGWLIDADAYVAQAREAIVAEGHDPDEVLPRTKKRPPSRRW